MARITSSAKVVDRAVCSKCGGLEISCTLGLANAAGFSYPSYARDEQ